MAWLPHVAVEYEILVPALNDAGIDEDKIAAIAIQKDIINLLLADLLQDESGQFGQAKLEALTKQFDALLAGAAAEDNGLFAIVSAAENSVPGLNAQMKARYDRTKQRFANMDEAIGEAMVMLAPRRLSVPSNSRQNRREFEMSRYSNERERDDHGRFVSDHERGYSRNYRGPGRDRDEQGRFMSEGGSRSRGRYDDEDDRRYSRAGPERDGNGRFMSEGGSRSRGRYDDEDERYGRRPMGRERDDEGRFTRRGWDNPQHGESGWYGDSEGHSQASRRGWDNPRHGESGWYGDPQGHSEASRRGWTIPATARAAGTATRKAIPRLRGADGSMATRATTGAGRRAMTMMTAGTRAAAAADTRTTTATSAATAVAAAMAVGPAIRKVTRRLRVAAGRTDADGRFSELVSIGRLGASSAVPFS